MTSNLNRSAHAYILIPAISALRWIEIATVRPNTGAKLPAASANVAAVKLAFSVLCKQPSIHKLYRIANV